MKDFLEKQIDSFFDGLEFQEDIHKYYLNNKQFKYSVSGIVQKFEPYTDWGIVRKKTALKRGVTEDVIQTEWDEEERKGCELGDETHIFAEHYALDRTLVPDTGHKFAATKFWNELPDHIIPLKLEARMYHKKHLFAGTSDVLLYNTLSGEVIIADYKTNKDLFKHYNYKKLLEPFNKLVDNPYNHYQIQLSLYQILLEQIPGIKVVNRVIIFLKADGNYELYELTDYTDVLKNQLEILEL